MRESSRVRLPHVPALDGLRGMAVLAVLLFHGGQLTGGYLGVDLFFVLSGFLITSLLLVEWEGTGAIALRRFWERRARRLLPALFGLLAVVAVLAVVFAKSYELTTWRWDAIATLFYGANWRQIASGAGYWDQYNAPSPLRHTWSLAIEEQFYLVWPLVVVLVLRGRRRAAAPAAGAEPSPRDHNTLLLLGVALVGAVVSATLMARVFDPQDPNRAYLGADTRAAAVLLGAALAIALRRWGPVRTHGGRVALEAAALVASAALLFVWATTEGTAPWLYHYGFFALGVGCVLVIAASSHPVRGPVGFTLGFAPLRWLGLISYGLYLWHWPVYVVLDANRGRLGLDGWALLGVKLAVSLALAIVSFFVLEQPIRRRGLAAWRRPVLFPAAAGFVVLAVLWATMGATERPSMTPTAAAEAAPPGVNERRDLPDLSADPDASALFASSSTATLPAAPSGPVPRPAGRRARVMVVGDSVGWLFGSSFEKQSSAFAIVAANRALFACPLASDSNRVRDERGITNERAECQRWPQHFREDTAKFRPDVVLVMYGGPPVGERDLAGEWHDLCDQTFHDWYTRQVSQAVDLLSATGAVVFLAPSAYSRFPFLDWPTMDRRTDCMNRVYREVAATKPAARIVPLDSFVCPADHKCLDQMDGVWLREDGIHYDHEGGDYVARWVLDQMLLPA